MQGSFSVRFQEALLHGLMASLLVTRASLVLLFPPCVLLQETLGGPGCHMPSAPNPQHWHCLGCGEGGSVLEAAGAGLEKPPWAFSALHAECVLGLCSRRLRASTVQLCWKETLLLLVWDEFLCYPDTRVL